MQKVLGSNPVSRLAGAQGDWHVAPPAVLETKPPRGPHIGSTVGGAEEDRDSPCSEEPRLGRPRQIAKPEKA
jgi:hypothetical protein